ncbi:hypothetical protein ACFV3R_21830 [Streptomyces sp. NPDC059740]|uniref:hypothetical protein n=1 Tax=Streptomyces sp. NPDC059740 TaxID=3346926 RepID=UPI003669D2D1
MDKQSDTGTKRQKKLDLSLAQVAGSAVAAAVAAYLAGRLGVYGTIIGAGVVSVVATTGGSVFQHLFRRTGEQIREAAVTTRPRPRRATVSRLPAGVRPPLVLPTFDRHGAEDDVTSVAAAERQSAPEEQSTRLLPQVTPATAGRPADRTQALPRLARTQVVPRPQVPAPTRSADRTQLVPRVDQATLALTRPEPPEDGDADEAGATTVLPAAPSGPRPPGTPGGVGAGEEPEEVGRATYGTRLRGWRRPVLGALGVFVLAMGGVTGVELLTGQTPDGSPGTTWGHFRGASGHVQRQQPSGTTPDHAVSDSPSSQEEPSGTPSPRQSGTGQDGEQGTERSPGGDSTASPGGATGKDGSKETATPTPTPTPGDGETGTDKDSGNGSKTTRSPGADATAPTDTP